MQIITDRDSRTCENRDCGQPLERRLNENHRNWALRRFCSADCANAGQRGVDDDGRVCELDTCNKPLRRKRRETGPAFRRRRYCELVCANRSRSRSRRQNGQAGTPFEGWTIPKWHRYAPCQSQDPEMFDPIPGPGFNQRLADAAAVCGACPFAGPCVLDGFAADDRWTIRGGLPMSTWRRKHPELIPGSDAA